MSGVRAAQETAGRGQPLLRLDNVSRHFGKLQAVQDVSFAMNEGELRAVIGAFGRREDGEKGRDGGPEGPVVRHRRVGGRLTVDGDAVKCRREAAGRSHVAAAGVPAHVAGHAAPRRE